VDSSEKIVKQNLILRGFKKIEYEPDGNIPPDFVVNDSIAIEVRRLNQNHHDGTRMKGLEETAYPLWQKIGNVVVELGSPVKTESWFVSYRFNRPLESWCTLKAKIYNALQNFSQQKLREAGSVLLGENFELDVIRASKVHQTMFVMGGFSDMDSGGWVLYEMERNILHCAYEKSKKIAEYRRNYSQWWLVLVDYIGYGIDDFNEGIFRNTIAIKHDWDKLVIVDPLNPCRYFDI
jgi:hypothetical protein